MPCTTSSELAKRYRHQIDFEFDQTACQTDSMLKDHRKICLKHLAKLSRKIEDQSRIVLQIEGRV